MRNFILCQLCNVELRYRPQLPRKSDCFQPFLTLKSPQKRNRNTEGLATVETKREKKYLARPPVGWQRTVEHPAHTTTVWAWLNTVVILWKKIVTWLNTIVILGKRTIPCERPLTIINTKNHLFFPTQCQIHHIYTQTFVLTVTSSWIWR